MENETIQSLTQRIIAFVILFQIFHYQSFYSNGKTFFFFFWFSLGVLVFPDPRLFAWPPALALVPVPGLQFVFTDPGPQFIFTSPGRQFLCTSPGLQFVLTGPDQK